MKALLFLSALIALVASQSNPLNTFLYQLELKVQETNAASCKNISMTNPLPEDQMKSFSECIQYSKKMTANLMSDFRPIAEKIVEDARLNVDGKYFEWDQANQKWYLPNNATADAGVDGLQENAKKLAYELDLAFKMLVQSQGASSLRRRAVTGSITRKAISKGTIPEVMKPQPRMPRMKPLNPEPEAALNEALKQQQQRVASRKKYDAVMKELYESSNFDRKSRHKDILAKNNARHIQRAGTPPIFRQIARQMVTAILVSSFIASLMWLIIAIVAVNRIGKIQDSVAEIAQNPPTATIVSEKILPQFVKETTPPTMDESMIGPLPVNSELPTANDASSPTPLAKFDESTGITYYFDPETKYWYYWDDEKQDYEWFSE